MPKVSVCIPAYENPEGIARLLESLLLQSFGDYEVIITDDSQSGAVEKAARAVFGRHGGSSGNVPDGRLRYVRNKERLGAVPNWNAAVRLAGGEYIKLMHHDDWFPDRDCLAKLVSLLDSDPGAALAFSGTRQVPLEELGTAKETGDGAQEQITADLPGYSRAIGDEELLRIREDWRNLYLGNTIGSPSAVLVRAGFVREKGIEYDEELTWLVDMDYYMQILKAGGGIAASTEPLVAIGTGKDQLTERCIRDADLNYRERTRIFTKFGLAGYGPAEDRYLDEMARYHIAPERVGSCPGIRDSESRYRAAVRREKSAEAARLAGTAGYLLGRAKDRLAKPADVLFCAAFFAELVLVILDKSEFRFEYASQVYRVTFLLFMAKLLTVRREKRESVFLLMALLFGAAVWRITGRNELIRFAAFTGALRGTDIRRSGRFAFYVTAAGSALLCVLSVTGLYGTAKLTQVFRDSVEVRYCLGHGHPNALHCMAAMLIILGTWLCDRRMRWYHYVLLAAANTGLYFLTDSRLGWAAAMLDLAVSALAHYSARLREGKILYFVSEAACAAALVFSAEAGIRGLRNPLLGRMDSFMSGRITSLWESSFHEGTLSTWGLFAGRNTEYYFDLGWVRLVYWYGIIPAAAVLILLFAVLRQIRLRHDGSALAMLTSCMVYTAVEAHLVSRFIGRNYCLLLIAAYIPAVLGLSRSESAAEEDRAREEAAGRRTAAGGRKS